MTVSEIMAAGMDLAEAADILDGKPMDSTEALARKLAAAADSAGIVPAAVDLHTEAFTDEERGLATAAVIERAERFMQQAAEKTAAKVANVNKPAAKAKADAAAVDARPLPILPKKDDGWYFDASEVTPDVPEYGPYDTKKECEAERASFMRSQKELAKDAPVPAAKPGPKIKRANPATEGVTPESESEETVTTATKPKKATKAKAGAKHKANGKPAKAAKPAKAPRAEKAKDGPAKVRYEKSACYVAGKILKKHGLKKGITQQMVDEATEEIGRKNEHQDWFNLRNAWHAIRAYIGQPVDGPKDE